MDVTATIDYDRGTEDCLEIILGNFGDQVKIEASGLFEGPIYIDRADLITVLCALDVGR